MHPILLRMAELGISSQVEFARLVEISPSYLNDIIRARYRCGAGAALKMHRRAGLDIGELLRWEPPSGAKGKRKAPAARKKTGRRKAARS